MKQLDYLPVGHILSTLLPPELRILQFVKCLKLSSFLNRILNNRMAYGEEATNTVSGSRNFTYVVLSKDPYA